MLTGDFAPKKCKRGEGDLRRNEDVTLILGCGAESRVSGDSGSFALRLLLENAVAVAGFLFLFLFVAPVTFCR